MSLSRIVFPMLGWDEFLHLISFLSIRDVYFSIGQLNRSGFLTFLREKDARLGANNSQNEGLGFSRLNHVLLPKLDTSHDKVLLVSYPRSGNSMLRQQLEMKTRIITGSDSRPNRTLSSYLLKCGYRGEGITDNSVWIVKSHYPERLGYIKFKADRVVLLVRNPYDAIMSYFHMGMTNTHDKNLSSEAFASIRNIFREFVENEAIVWKDFHDFWIIACKELNIPIHIVRYEDLLQDRDVTIQSILTFLSSGSPPQKYQLDQIKLHRKSHQTQSTMHDVDGETKPRYGVKKGGLGKALSIMTKEEIEFIRNITREYCSLLGYKLSIDSQSSTADAYRLELVAQSHLQAPLVIEESSIAKSIIEFISIKRNPNSLFRINDEYEIRRNSDKFGRKMTDLRRSLTNLDTNPFQTS